MKKNFIAVLFVFSISLSGANAQDGRANPESTPSPPPKSASGQKLSETLALNLQKQTVTVSRERREQAYAKMLEAQRYIWSSKRQRSQAALQLNVMAAKAAIKEALEFDADLPEAYATLGELFLRFPPQDLDEASAFSKLAVKLDKDNFGAHRILAILYTIESGLKEKNLNKTAANNAVTQWKELTRLDPQNAEAWAFLSILYEDLNKNDERIEALKNWLSSTTPLDSGFYRSVMGREEDLSPQAATPKLGAALLETGSISEAVEILSRAISEDPTNTETVRLLSEAIEQADERTAMNAIDALQQAVFANPDNTALVALLAQVQIRTGKTEDGIKTLREIISKVGEKDKNAAANLQIALGDIYVQSGKYDEAVAVYQNALRLRGIESNQLITDDERDFAYLVYDKITNTYKTAGRIKEARIFLENSRSIFGKSDVFIDRQLFELLRETGQREEALKILRAARSRFPADYSLLRLEASVLTELGRVDEAVKLIQPLIGSATSTPSLMTDDFINYIFISGLYTQAKRGADAIKSANLAYGAANGEERKQIAKLTLASAQQVSGDFAASEKTLRDILKQTPNNPIALNNLGYFLVERGERFDEALELIKQAVAIDENNPSYLDSLGWAYFKLGKYDEAEKHLKKAAILDASSPTIQEHLGDVYAKQKKLDLAKTTWKKALNLSSDAEEVSRLENKIK